MSSTNPQILKGFRDFLPKEMAIRQKVIATLKEVFESYGFEPLETPSLEYAETLLGKNGDEADRLVYTFKDQGDRMVGLRYDLTVPVSRVLAMYNAQIPLPFKRYQIQQVWRAEKPQKGRYREVCQCDIDTFGSLSPLADAEIIAVIVDALKALKFRDFTVRINSRKVLFGLMEQLGITDKTKQLSYIQSIDKLDKKSKDEVEKELGEKELPVDEIGRLFTLIESARPDENLAQMIEFLEKLGVSSNYYKFDPILSRGLDYYTGPIFETYVGQPKIGSITGGGRYDNLVKTLGGPDISATGTTLGLDRICDVISEQNLWPDVSPTSTRVLVTVFDRQLLNRSIEIVKQLKSALIPCEIYLEPGAKLDKQLKYADKKGIPFVAIIGPEEADKGFITLKNLATKEQKTVSASDLSKTLLSW